MKTETLVAIASGGLVLLAGIGGVLFAAGRVFARMLDWLDEE